MHARLFGTLEYARKDKATLFQSVLTTIHYPFGHETHDDSKVHILLEGHKILQNLHQLFGLCTASQIIGRDFAKFCSFLRIYEL